MGKNCNICYAVTFYCPENISLGAIIRDSKIHIPNQHLEIRPGDELLLFSKAKNIELAEDLFT